MAAPVKLLEGEWEAPMPTSVANGDTVDAVWRFNVNDDGAAPTNDDVPNVTARFQVQHGVFEAIPELCLTSAVTPVSTISADGATLICNVGTQKEGSALRITTPVVASGLSGEQVMILGAASDDRDPIQLPPIPIRKSFGMDILWGGGSSSATATSRSSTFNWTLFLDKGSIAGPNQVTYTLSVDSTIAGLWGANPSCSRFSGPAAVYGHPWSDSTHSATQTAPWVNSCAIWRTTYDVAAGTATYVMQLTGIDYSLTRQPTKDSTGAGLPADTVAVASGQITITQETTATGGRATFESSAPTYTSSNGALTSKDDSSNNTAAAAWSTGTWWNGWVTWFTGSSAPSWTDTYLAGVGSTVSQGTDLAFQNVANVARVKRAAVCNILDTRYVTFTGLSATASASGATVPLSDLTNSIEYWYYTGSDALVDPASASYDPNAWTGCSATGTGWSTTPPSDLSTVRAVKAVFAVTDAVRASRVSLQARSTIKASTPLGQDIWEWGSYARSLDDTITANEWISPGRSASAAGAPAGSTLTPGLRYPFTAGGRDDLRTVGSTPSVSKAVTPLSVLPGDTVTYTIHYAANATIEIPNRDGYVLVDTLPAGVAYVPGSASPAPVVTTNAAGRQVLTWTIDGLPINTTRSLSFQATIPEGATSGQTFVNQVTATVDGTSASSSAMVRVPSDGITRIVKESSLTQIPNPEGTGNGSASWSITITSADPRKQAFTDTIDVLPWVGDGRGTTMAGSYRLSGPVSAPSGATVYYSTADPSSIRLDPDDASNGATGGPVSSIWSTVYTADATAVRVIGGVLAPRAAFTFTIPYKTAGMDTGDTLVNTAWGRAAGTRLDMRTSASVVVAPYYAMTVKKYVLGAVGDSTAGPDAENDDLGSWRDANDSADYPRYNSGDDVLYRVCVTNTGSGDLTDIEVSDDKQPTLGAFTIASLAAGKTRCGDPYTVTYGRNEHSMLVNTATASTITPDGNKLSPSDPAGIYLRNHGVQVVKSSDPADGSAVAPGSTVKYAIAFTGTGDSESYVDYSDHLDKVLDDATLDVASLTASSTDLAGVYSETGRSIRISGYVEPGQVVTFTYQVRVDTVDELGDGDLVNVVTPPGGTPGDSCKAGDPQCTEHPVTTPKLILKKDLAGRAHPTDQFSISIERIASDGSTELGRETTRGSSTGLQEDAGVGPVKAAPGAVYQLGERGAAATDLTAYSASITCATASGAEVAAASIAGDSHTWQLTYPQPDAAATDPDTVTCVITNQPVKRIHIEKRGQNCDVGQPTCSLPGAEFALYDSDPSSAGASPIIDAVVADVADASQFTSTALAVPGEYWLVETTAPAGFSLMATPVKLALSTSGITLDPSAAAVATVKSTDTFTVQVLDTTAAPLPRAGGDGPWPFLGLGLLFAGAAWASLKTSDRRRARSAAR